MKDTCRSGEIGRHARFRGVWRKLWGFESPLRHMEKSLSKGVIFFYPLFGRPCSRHSFFFGLLYSRPSFSIWSSLFSAFLSPRSSLFSAFHSFRSSFVSGLLFELLFFIYVVFFGKSFYGRGFWESDIFSQRYRHCKTISGVGFSIGFCSG